MGLGSEPRQGTCLRLAYQIAKPSDEKTTILIVTEYLTVLDAPAMI